MKVGHLVSILMPVKNGIPYLRDCLRSIILQTYTNWELIVVDDHSSDETYKVLKEFSNRDQRISSYKSNGKGIIEALRMAYTYCNGSYVTRMDADDIMDPQKLELMLKSLVDKGNGNVAIGLVDYFKQGGIGKGYVQYAKWLNSLTLAQKNFEQIYRECTIPSPCWMMSIIDFDSIGSFNHDRYPEDYDLAFRMKKHRLKVVPVGQILHHWRDHDSRATRNDPNYLDNRFIELKVNYFLEEEVAPAPLILWGCGSKGKQVAKELLLKKVEFKWITNNQNKIGHNIYGLIIEDQKLLSESEASRVIISISGISGVPYESDMIKNYDQHRFYFFT